jgi:hypothetical protein
MNEFCDYCGLTACHADWCARPEATEVVPEPSVRHVHDPGVDICLLCQEGLGELAPVIELAAHQPHLYCGDGCKWELPKVWEARYAGNAEVLITFACPECGAMHTHTFGG